MITLISYTEGCFGEFICSMIANDKNYYKGNDSRYIKNRNSYMYYDILKEEFKLSFDIFNLRLKCDFEEEILNQVKKIYNEKHICARTHSDDFRDDWNPIFNSKIMNINKVRMFIPKEHYVFSLFMVMMKAHMPAGKIEDGPMWPLGLIADKDSGVRVPGVDYSLFDNVDTDQYINYIKWETIRCTGSEKTESIAVYLNEYFQWYEKNSLIGTTPENQRPDWTYLNVYDLMTKPEEVVEKWREKLDLNDVFDIDKIKRYHSNNLNLLYEQYNLMPEQLNNIDWKKLLIDRAVRLYDIPLKKKK